MPDGLPERRRRGVVGAGGRCIPPSAAGEMHRTAWYFPRPEPCKPACVHRRHGLAVAYVRRAPQRPLRGPGCPLPPPHTLPRKALRAATRSLAACPATDPGHGQDGGLAGAQVAAPCRQLIDGAPGTLRLRRSPRGVRRRIAHGPLELGHAGIVGAARQACPVQGSGDVLAAVPWRAPRDRRAWSQGHT